MTPAHGRLMASHQRWALPVLSGLTLAALVLPPAGHLGAWLVAGLAVAVLGIPHGALDAPLGMRIARRIGGAPATAVFLVAYGIVALAFLGLVSIAPMLALTLFLALAVVHFGEQDALARGWPGDRLEILATGLTPIGAAWLFHPERTIELFVWLVGEGHRGTLEAAAMPVVVGWVVATTLSLLRHARQARLSTPPRMALGETAVVLALFWVLPPLLAFTAYFCLVHAPRHVIEFAAAERPAAPVAELPRLARLAAPATLVTWAAAGVAFWLQARFGVWDQAAARTLFWTLAALTPPHMMLLWWVKAHPGQRHDADPQGSGSASVFRQ